jgi:hypothetical protein
MAMVKWPATSKSAPNAIALRKDHDRAMGREDLVKMLGREVAV